MPNTMTISAIIDKSRLEAAERVLADNGIEPDEAPVVLQAIGYVLLGQELYPQKEA